jgi:formyl-CoA transferase
VNDLEGLSRHAELRRIVVATSGGLIGYPAPAPRVVTADRHYGSVPSIGGLTKKPVA